MGGMESLLTIWLHAANFKEKKFLMNDINQLESCLNQAQALQWKLQVLIRCSDLNKGQRKQMWDPGMPEFWPVPEDSPTLHTIEAALIHLLTLRMSLQTVLPNLPSMIIRPDFLAHCHVAFNYNILQEPITKEHVGKS